MKYLPLAILSLAVAVCFMIVEYKKEYGKAVLLKGLASLSFVVFGVLSSFLCSDPVYAKRIVIGLVLGCIADVLLNLRFVLKTIGQKVFLVGILVFLSGHILYLTALIPYCGNLKIWIVIGIILSALLLVWIFKRISAKIAFKIFGIFYIGAIMIMTAVSFGVLMQSGTTTSYVYFLGALMFLISDIILILNTFGPKQQQKLRVMNLSFYYVGQIMIALSLQFL